MVCNVFVGFCRTDVVADSFAVCNIREKDRFIAVCNITERERERERERDTEIHYDGQIQLTHFYYTAL
jgi:hypothetical protein